MAKSIHTVNHVTAERYRFNFRFVTCKRPDIRNPGRMIETREPTVTLDILAHSVNQAIDRFRDMCGETTNFHLEGHTS